MKKQVVFSLLIATASVLGGATAFSRTPVEPRSDNEVAPFRNREWLNASCRFHVLQDYGAYGNQNLSKDLQQCVVYAQMSLVFMADTEREDGRDEALMHLPTRVEFFSDSDVPQVCTLQSKKTRYDQLPAMPDAFYLEQLSGGPVDAGLKTLLDENVSVNCPLQPKVAQPSGTAPALL